MLLAKSWFGAQQNVDSNPPGARIALRGHKKSRAESLSQWLEW